MMTVDQLRSRFAVNKEIPAVYEEEILTALSHYPELITANIRFVLTAKASVPYGTKPTLASCFKHGRKRHYTVTLLESADYPTSEALFKKLTPSMRIAVIAHELGHVKQYDNCNVARLLKTLASFIIQKQRRKLERDADIAAITHGFGQGLLEHAIYIRSIPGYVEKRPAINTDYLLPPEIALRLRENGQAHAA